MKTRAILFCSLALFAAQTAFATSSSDSSGTGTAAPSVNTAANNTQGQNSGGQGAAAAAGAMYAALSAMEFSQCGPHNPGACALGAMFAGMSALSFMQSGEHGNVAGQAYNTGLNTDAYTTGTTPQTLQNSDGNGSLNSASADIAKLKNGIGGNMADIATGKITTADGKTYSASDFSSPASMAAAGFSPDQIAQAMEVSGKVEKKALEKVKLGAMTASNGYDEGGGGGGAGGSSGKGHSSSDGDGAGSGLGALARSPAQVAGMTKNFNGEPIGVAGDSIFDMMNRRYQVKEKQNAFLTDNDLLQQK